MFNNYHFITVTLSDNYISETRVLLSHTICNEASFKYTVLSIHNYSNQTY